MFINKFYSRIYILMLKFLIILLTISIWPVKASGGDRSETYRRCVHACKQSNCSSVLKIQKFHDDQPISNRLLFWTCDDECSYICMWKTVDMFITRGIPVQQFHGKWPFIRVLGIQEPASVLASILNGIVLFYAWRKFKIKVPNTAPLFYAVYGMGLVGMNAWFWSAVFHTRDYNFTEKMDYFCALSLVLYSFFTVCIRFSGTNSLTKSAFFVGTFVAFFMQHIYNLTYIKFDYGYNMKVNIAIGLLNSLGWMIWYIINRKKPHSWKCIISVIMLDLLLLLELGDFPPVFWIFDAHSLWHFSTVPLPLLWYSFLTDECLQLHLKNE